MIKGKATYLNRLYSKLQFKTIDVDENISGASPPSLFVGSWNYPKVSVGPLIPPIHGDTQIMDLPENWITGGKDIQDVINFRFSLVRGKETINIHDVQSKPAQNLQEIALAKNSLELEAEFKEKPHGVFFHEDIQPFGPSAQLKELKLGNVKMEFHLEKFYYDTDLLSKDAIINSYDKGIFVSTIQKALSVGAFGLEKNRKFVPTRWSITAVDDTISLDLLKNIKSYPSIDNFQVFEVKTFNNYFAILLMPGSWQYEFLEAFIHVMGNEEVLFSDAEGFKGRKEYASIGGCYYSTRLAVAEKLEEIKKQSGVLVFRESYPGYIPTGSWLVRESVRESLRNKPTEFHDLKSALQYISSKLKMPFTRYRNQSSILKQSILKTFVK